MATRGYGCKGVMHGVMGTGLPGARAWGYGCKGLLRTKGYGCKKLLLLGVIAILLSSQRETSCPEGYGQDWQAVKKASTAEQGTVFHQHENHLATPQRL